ncbi:MAG: ImmA/IrrE family metallo-endopeptidase [Bacteroidales bacterium]|nr:ImmA/IrrE family metallo-endopeptidase [Bacteroidales bacterium]
MDNINDIFAKRLKLARKRAKLSMDELCSIMKPNVSKQTISKYEAGKCMPSGLLMMSLAKALKVDIDYFARPFDFNIDDLNISFRKKASVGNKDLESLKVGIQDDIERYLEVETILGLKPIVLEPLTASTLSTSDDMRRMARLLRDRWGLGDNPILNVQELLESKGIKVILTKGAAGFDGVSGVIKKDNSYYSVVVLNPSIEMCERRRLTAMHELGHLLFNDSFGEELTPKDIEKLCNAFANEMLFPESVARYWFEGKRQIHLPELKNCQQNYGISIEAIVYKLHELDIINDARYKMFSILKNTKLLFKQAVRTSRFKETDSMRLEAMVYKAMAEGLISKERAAVLLNKPMTDVEYNMETI